MKTVIIIIPGMNQSACTYDDDAVKKMKRHKNSHEVDMYVKFR